MFREEIVWSDGWMGARWKRGSVENVFFFSFQKQASPPSWEKGARPKSQLDVDEVSDGDNSPEAKNINSVKVWFYCWTFCFFPSSRGWAATMEGSPFRPHGQKSLTQRSVRIGWFALMVILY